MKTLIIILFALNCYGQTNVPYDNLTTGGDSLLYLSITKLWTPPTTITIGRYTFEMDSIATMTARELNDFVVLVNFVSNGFHWNDDIVERLCVRFLPERLRIKFNKGE